MIIECFCKKKKFEIDASLIPSEGRSIQCGSCNQVWFYIPKKIEVNYNDSISNENQTNEVKDGIEKESSIKIKKEIKSNKLKKNNQIKISKILSYIVVLIISFTALILLLETFRLPLIVIFPNLELLLYNLFETLKDMFLFSKNLII